VPTTYTQDLAAPLPVVLQSQTSANAIQYVYALGTQPLAQYGNTWEYLLADALGSVRQIVGADGNVTLAESYEPYGSVLSSIGTASSIFAYAGEQVDTSGLVFLRARYMQPTLGIFLARDPWSGDQLRPGSMNGWNYGDDNPVNRVDPSGRFGAVALAKTFGYEEGMSGVVQMLTQPSRWNGTSSTHHWGWMKLLLDAEDGDTAVLRGAIPVYTSRVLGTFYCSDIHTNIDDSGMLSWSPGPVGIFPIGDPGFSLSPGYLFGDSRPLAPTQFNIPSWRQQGHYVLVSQQGLIAYSDEVGNGNQTDLPDVGIISGGGSLKVIGGQGSYMVDKFGTVYGSLSVNVGPSTPVSGIYGEGYLFKGSLWASGGGMHREDWNKDDFYDALTKFSFGVSGSVGAGTSYQFTLGPYVLVVYSSGYQAGFSISGGLTGQLTSVPGFAWDELFYWPAPSFTEVVHQAIASAQEEPCAICQSGK
jgi:RHS repeat-associated protein